MQVLSPTWPTSVDATYIMYRLQATARAHSNSTIKVSKTKSTGGATVAADFVTQLIYNQNGSRCEQISVKLARFHCCSNFKKSFTQRHWDEKHPSSLGDPARPLTFVTETFLPP